MITIDLIVRYLPVPLSIEKKEETEAQALYQQILEAIKSPETQIIELTCDRQTEKKIAVVSDQVSGVVISQKDGSNTTGKVPGFFAAIGEK